MSVPMYETIADYLLTEIREGRLREGDRVMSERELADHFGVSTMTSKGALARLAALGVIVRSRGRGSYVAQSLPDLSQIGLESETIIERADSLRGSVVGLIIPGFDDSFGAETIRAVESRCHDLGLHLVLRLTDGNRNLEKDAITDLLRLGVDGLLILPVHGEHFSTDILRLVLDGFPLVLMDRYMRGIPARAVYTNNTEAAREMTEYLMDLGHRQIAYVSPSPDSTSSIEDRIQGYMLAHAARGLGTAPDLLFHGVSSTLTLKATEYYEKMFAQDLAALRTFVGDHPEVTAYLACEYGIAILLRTAITDLGLRVPEDCSIACFDHQYSALTAPFFTHVLQDEEMTGCRAVDVLVSLMRGEEPAIENVIPHRIVLGSSTAAPKTR